MDTEESYFESFDKVRIFFRGWHNNQPSKVCVIVHGYGEHSARYDEFVRSVMPGSDYSFFACDLRGQGKSEGLRADAASFSVFMKDLQYFFEFLKKRNIIKDNSPIALMGHSMGGLIAIQHCRAFPDHVQYLVLSSPCLKLAGIPGCSWFQQLVRFANRFIPSFVASNLVKPRHLTHDTNKIKNYFSDSLIERRISIRLSAGLMDACTEISSTPLTTKAKVLLIASGDDRIVSLKAETAWFHQVQAPTKLMKVFPGFYHELLQEVDRKQVFQEIQKFINI